MIRLGGGVDNYTRSGNIFKSTDRQKRSTKYRRIPDAKTNEMNIKTRPSKGGLFYFEAMSVTQLLEIHSQGAPASR